MTLTNKRACYESLDFNYFTCVAEVIFVWVEPILVMVTCVACTETIVAFCCKKKRVGANEIESVFFAHDCATSIWSETEIVIGKQRT